MNKKTGVFGVLLLLTLLFWIGLKAIDAFFDTNTLEFRPLIEFHVPVEVKKRVKSLTIQKVEAKETIAELQTSPEERLQAQIRKTFGPAGETAILVSEAESGMTPNRISYTGCCYGLFQINVDAHFNRVPGSTREAKAAWLTVPENNLIIAKQIYDEQGWGPWDVCGTAVDC